MRRSLGATAWELDPDDVIALRETLSARGTPLSKYPNGRILRGVLTGLTEAFVLDDQTRHQIVEADPKSAEVIRPFVQGTHLRPWYVETSEQFLIELRSSANFSWPWSGRTDTAESIFQATYPAIHSHLIQFRDAAIKRLDQGKFWWELRACGYWDEFRKPKIVWPDISKLPRFSMDTEDNLLGNTGFVIPGSDYYLLGVLSSWATWFFISKTAQPLRLRGDRWQYRLFAQFMEHIPIPDASTSDRAAIAKLSERCTVIGAQQYQIESQFQRRLIQTFGYDKEHQLLGILNNKAQAWWEHSLNELGDSLKTSFKLKANPFKKPQTADEWEPYLTEKRSAIEMLTRQLVEAETEINDRVYKLFKLTPEEIKLLQREVEH
jgi:hypothetical protein